MSTLKSSAERLRNQLGVFCMTSENDNILMWAHYTAAHTGFCLGFKTENDFFGRANPVIYSQARPCLNLIKPLDPKKSADDLFTKSKDWEYEHEWRIVDHKKGPGVHSYRASQLIRVILGCRISPANRVRIMQWCRKRRPRPRIYWAQEKDREFGLEIVPVPWS